LHEEGEDVAALVAHEAVVHPFLRDDGEVAVRAAVKRARSAKVRPSALELHVLADDSHDVRRLPDLLDHVVGNETHVVNSTTVTPCPPWFGGAKPKRSTRVSADRISWTSWRSTPVPLPWITRRYGRSASTASSSALTSRASASSTRRPRKDTSVAAVAVECPAPAGGRAGLGGRRGAPAGSCRRRLSSSRESHVSPFPFPPGDFLAARVDPCGVFPDALLARRELALPGLELPRPCFDSRKQRIERPLAVRHRALGDVQDRCRDSQPPGDGEPVGAPRDALEQPERGGEHLGVELE